MADMREGHEVLLLGPVGIGKTWLLGELERRCRAEGRPCARSGRTETLADIRAAIGAAYRVPVEGRRRGRLRGAVEAEPGMLLLDHVGRLGTAARGFLRSLRGLGLGVAFACDIQHPRDHARVRALRLAHREVFVPPAPRATLERMLDERLGSLRLDGRDRDRLVAAAEGRPGRIDRFVQLIRAGTPPAHISLLRAAALIEEWAVHEARGERTRTTP
jgi:hypothetical protein